MSCIGACLVGIASITSAFLAGTLRVLVSMLGQGDRSLTLKWQNSKTWCHVEEEKLVSLRQGQGYSGLWALSMTLLQVE